MKKYKSLGINILTTLFLLLCVGCSKEEISTFDPSTTALNIWVGTEYSAYETVTYNFSYAYEEGSVSFYAQISGMPSKTDRTFRLEPFGPDSALIVNTIRTENYIIPAGAIGGEYKVFFNSKALTDPSIFTERDGSISFRMVPNDEFAIGTEGRQKFTIILKNYLAKPDNWEKANYPRVALSKYFGTYSRTKYQFMIETLGLIDFEINYNTQTSYDEESNVVSAVYAIYLQQVMQKALNEYNETHSTPLTDEFGVPVSF